jgi:hypothetical protein
VLYYEFSPETKEISKSFFPSQLCDERNHERVINSDYFDDGNIHVSTVFLCIDHGHGEYNQPILFETMIFGSDKLEGYQERCATYEEALSMHARAINALFEVN